MSIVLFEFEAAHAPLLAPLQTMGPMRHLPAPLTAQNAAKFADAQVISTLNESDLSEDVLAQLPNLKHIASRTTGLDHIPWVYCQACNIQVTSVPHYGQHTVAEHAFGLLLTLSHRLHLEIPRPQRGDFSPKGARGFDLFGKTLGVIGTGNIGRNTLRIAAGFGMRIIGHDIDPDFSLCDCYNVAYMSKADMLAEADVVSLHVPGDDSTFHLMDEAAFYQMKPGAILINTARGSVVDILALHQALVSGHLAGACLDVLPHEHILRNPAHLHLALQNGDRTALELQAIQSLLAMPQAVISPHTAYNTVEAVERIVKKTVENICFTFYHSR